VTLAVMSYSGYDIEDAAIHNKWAIERSYARCPPSHPQQRGLRVVSFFGGGGGVVTSGSISWSVGRGHMPGTVEMMIMWFSSLVPVRRTVNMVCARFPKEPPLPLLPCRPAPSGPASTCDAPSGPLSKGGETPRGHPGVRGCRPRPSSPRRVMGSLAPTLTCPSQVYADEEVLHHHQGQGPPRSVLTTISSWVPTRGGSILFHKFRGYFFLSRNA